MLTLTADTSVKELEVSISNEMVSPIDHLKKELIKLRTSRANTAMIEDLKVTCYGSTMVLKNLAVISAPDARLLVVQPWDKSNIADIEKALQASDLGSTPISDGDVIRIQLPQISSSRRDELIKLLGKRLEECKVSIRNVRKDFQNLVRSAEKKHTISEDFSKTLLSTLQKSVDSFIAKADELAKNKELNIKKD